jgi:hypothetical protein
MTGVGDIGDFGDVEFHIYFARTCGEEIASSIKNKVIGYPKKDEGYPWYSFTDI